MGNSLGSISEHTKRSHAYVEVNMRLKKIFTKEKLAFIIIMKQTEEEQISILTVMNFVQMRNVIIKTAITHIIKSSRYITRTDINLNFVKHTKIKT